MQAFQEQQETSSGLRNRVGAGEPQEGTYASAAQTQTRTPASLNRFQRTRMEEEEDLRKAIEASLAESGTGAENQGTSLGASQLGSDARTNETVPLVASDQPVDEMTTTTLTSLEVPESKGFVDGLVSSVFEVRRLVWVGEGLSSHLVLSSVVAIRAARCQLASFPR
jgi:hypothetical protein